MCQPVTLRHCNWLWLFFFNRQTNFHLSHIVYKMLTMNSFFNVWDKCIRRLSISRRVMVIKHSSRALCKIFVTSPGVNPRWRNSPTELSAVYFGPGEEAYYSALIWQRLQHKLWPGLELQSLPAMWETVAQTHQSFIAGKRTGTFRGPPKHLSPSIIKYWHLYNSTLSGLCVCLVISVKSTPINCLKIKILGITFLFKWKCEW